MKYIYARGTSLLRLGTRLHLLATQVIVFVLIMFEIFLDLKGEPPI